MDLLTAGILSEPYLGFNELGMFQLTSAAARLSINYAAHVYNAIFF